MSDDDIDPATTTLTAWLDRLAEAHGAPGGGAACAVLAGIGAALLGMVARYTDHPAAEAAVPRLTRLRREAVSAGEEDGIRSAAFGSALAMEDGPDRETAVRTATLAATESSLAVGRIGASLVDEARALDPIANAHVEADLLVAVGALKACLDGSIATVASDLAILARHGEEDAGMPARLRAFDDALADLRRRRRVLDDVGAS